MKLRQKGCEEEGEGLKSREKAISGREEKQLGPRE